MAIKLNPPPLTVPAALSSDKSISAFFGSLINVIYQMWTALYSIRFSAPIKTTDATITGIVRIPVDKDRTMLIESRIVGRRTGGVSGTTGDSAWYVMTGTFKNIAGVLTQVGTTNVLAGEDQAGWNVGLQTSGNEVVVVVQGAAGNNITWESTMSTYQVGA